MKINTKKLLKTELNRFILNKPFKVKLIKKGLNRKLYEYFLLVYLFFYEALSYINHFRNF